MNIGILTMYYNNYNYGGQLQAYALCEMLGQEGISVKQISFDSYAGNPLDKWLGRIRRNINKIYDIRKIKEAIDNSRHVNERRNMYMGLLLKDNNVNRFNDFMENIPHTEYVNSRTIKALADAFDKVILGGDQIWNPQYFNSRYYGNWVAQNVSLIAYSVSGTDIFSKDEKRRLIKYTKKIDSIAVREEGLLDLLKTEYKDKNLSCVLDPVFLNTSQQWENLAIDYQIEEPYLFAYLLSEDSTSRVVVSKLAKDKQLKLVTIPHARGLYNECDKNFGDIQILNAGPREFLGLIRNSSMVYTDSFHGTCFSIIFHKEFYCIENNKYQECKTNGRLRYLLEKVGLMERLISMENISEEQVKQSINYEIVDKKLLKEVHKSKKWLLDALNEK